MPDALPAEALVDPAVSRAKFERELLQYREIEDAMIRRGQWLLKAGFPEIFAVFAAPRSTPPVVVFGALLDFSDYDLLPPSVRLVNPFTRVPYAYNELPHRLAKLDPSNPHPLGPNGPPGSQDLLQAHDGHIPFLCVPGIREYHAHPAHTGDDWLLRRTAGEGSLYHILDLLWRYGADPVGGLQIVQVQAVLGIACDRLPA